MCKINDRKILEKLFSWKTSVIYCITHTIK